MGASTVQTPAVAAPAEVAAESNFWTLSIQDLDRLIDGLTARSDLLVQTEGKCRDLGRRLRESLAIVREVRDVMLAENYDANRKGEGVVKRAGGYR